MLLLLLACAATSEPRHRPGADDTAADTGSLEPAGWTVMVWMDGDNDLESYVTLDLNELEAGDPGPGVNVVVQADRHPDYDASDGDWTGTRRYRIVGDDDEKVVSSPVLEELGEVDMGDPEALSEFLLWAGEQFPAENYLLSLWDHGSSWYLAGGPSPPPGVASDDTSRSELSVAEGELAQGLDAFVAAAGPLDVVAFDACNMGGFEVAHALREHARYLVAAESWVGWGGLQYTPMVETLTADPATEPEVLAVQAARDAVEQGGELSYSATDLAGLDALAASVDALATGAIASEATFDALMDARADARGAESGPWRLGYLDLADLAAVGTASPDAALATLSQQVGQDLDAAVLGAYGTAPLEWVGGLTIFFDTYDLDVYSLDSANWARETHWDELLVLVRDAEQAAR